MHASLCVCAVRGVCVKVRGWREGGQWDTIAISKGNIRCVCVCACVYFTVGVNAHMSVCGHVLDQVSPYFM